MYNFIKLSDAPEAEDGATHVLGTKDGQVVRVPASGLGAVALDLDIGEASVGPTSVLDASTRDANALAGATLKLPTGEAYTADDSGAFVAEELYTALSDYIRRGCVLLFRLFAGEEFAGATLAAAAMCTDYGDARMLRLLAEGLGYIAIFDCDPGDM
nr:MAG TPA: hypothetical protein [Caudoviricetes sp.]